MATRRTAARPPKGDQGTPQAALSPHLTADLAAAWPELQALLAWWRERHELVEQAGAPERALQRQTYHVEKRFIEAIRREADLQGLTYAAVVNRAFAQYFAGERST